MKRMQQALIAGATLGLMALAPPQNWGDDVEPGQAPSKGQLLCRKLKDKTIPAADVADARRAAPTLKGCDAEALYYGIGRPADPVKARQCAILHASAVGAEPESLFDGDELLMVIYANGRGAARDVDLAIRLSCGLQAAPAEHDGRIESLLALKSGRPATPFHYCQDITSGYAMGWCARHEQRFAVARREAEAARRTAALPPSARPAFQALWTAAAAYAEARGRHETDLSGTARGAEAVGSEEAVWAEFLALLDRVASPKPPAGGPAEAQAADAALNAAYRQRMATAFEDGTVTADDVRQTERIWLRYRDAWSAYVRLAHPGVSERAVVAHLTRARTAQLKALMP